jgi:ubiquinone/menaquinone biosynthesis C-methylase UbiE
MTTHAERTYVPAAGHDWALPLYDPIVTLLGGNRTRKALVDRARLAPGQRVLEIGCGTGSLLLQIKRSHPDVEVVGFDPDPKALARAKRKAERAAVALQLDQASSDDMPYPVASFDRVFSSFMFHHLGADEREKTLREVRRVLEPEGSLHLLDFGGTDSGSHGSFMRLLHSSHQLQDNSDDRILTLMRQAGFSEVRKVGGGSMLFGQIRLSYYYGGASG